MNIYLGHFYMNDFKNEVRMIEDVEMTIKEGKKGVSTKKRRVNIARRFDR